MSPAEAVAASRRSLGRYLLVWILVAQLVVWAIIVAAGWSASQRETRKFTDGHLVAVTQLWLRNASWRHGDAVDDVMPVPGDSGHEYAQDIAVLVWENGQLVKDSDGLAAGLALSEIPAQGLTVLHHRDAQGHVHDWRAYVETFRVNGQERRVASMLDLDKRYAMAVDVAEHLAEPAFLLVPLLGLVMWWTIRRGLRPLDRLSEEVATLDAFAGQRLDTRHRFREFASTV
ncbi:MAG: hypothetical protein KDF54_15605, partial [Hydrogenophaga sp.]|nr:hypothetical protein [Hydrogenophaga sp.]